ncbi:MAG: FHA domain-containing protein [Anaerolineae bacterium]
MSEQLVLQIRTAQRSSEFVPTGSEITLGRAPDNDLVLQDPSVSGHHAELVATGDGYRVRDLNSTNVPSSTGSVCRCRRGSRSGQVTR